MQIFVLQMKVVMLTDGETGHQQIVITDGRIVSGPRVRTLTYGYEFNESGWIQRFDDKKKIKSTAENCLKSFFDQKLQFTYPDASIKVVQATRESLKKREHPGLVCINFVFIWAIFSSWIWIRFANPDRDPGTPLNPDQQHCFPHTTILKKQCFRSGSRQRPFVHKKRTNFIFEELSVAVGLEVSSGA
jgi:hypothetical protein